VTVFHKSGMTFIPVRKLPIKFQEQLKARQSSATETLAAEPENEQTPVIPELVALKRQYAKPLKALAEQRAERTQQLTADYAASLQDQETAMTRQGNLDGVLAAKTELERIQTGKQPSDDERKNMPGWLVIRRTRYDASLDRLSKEQDQKENQLRESYVKDLQALQTLLTQRGKIDAAVTVKQECEQVLAGRPFGGEMAGSISSLSQGLVLYFSLSKDTGKEIPDQSGNHNEGKVLGAKFSQSDGRGGYEFAGNTSSHIVVPRSASLEPTDGITISMWIKGRPGQAAGSGWGTLLRKSNNFQPGYFIRGGGISAFQLVDAHAATVASLGFPEFSATKWQHIAATYSRADGVAATYQDGKRINQKAFNKPLMHSGDLYIGGASVAGDDGGFRGLISEVRIYNRGLSAAEVQALSSRGLNLR
jgi:hypothetical protein